MHAPMIWVLSHDPDTRRLIGLNLNKRGFRTREGSLEDGVVASDAKPHLIILETYPRAEASWDAVCGLRQSPWLEGVPLILILAAAPTASRLVPLQPVRWVQKPLAMDALLSLVRESLA